MSSTGLGFGGAGRAAGRSWRSGFVVVGASCTGLVAVLSAGGVSVSGVRRGIASSGAGGRGAASLATGGASLAGLGFSASTFLIGFFDVNLVNSSTVIMSTGSMMSWLSSVVITGVHKPTTSANATCNPRDADMLRLAITAYLRPPLCSVTSATLEKPALFIRATTAATRPYATSRSPRT